MQRKKDSEEINQQTQIQFISERKECRICLEAEENDFESSKLIEPCGCLGSVSHVHEDCIKQWINRNKIQGQKWVKCELCKERIEFQIQSKRQCFPSATIQQNIQANPYIFVFFVIIFLINIGFIIFMGVLLGNETFTEGDYNKADELKLGITITAIILLFLITLIILILVIKTYCLTYTQKITKIFGFKKGKSHSRPKISQPSIAQIVPEHIIHQIS